MRLDSTMTCGSSSSHEAQLSAFRQARNVKFRFRDFSRAIGRRLISGGNLDTAARPTVQIGVQGDVRQRHRPFLTKLAAPLFLDWYYWRSRRSTWRSRRVRQRRKARSMLDSGGTNPSCVVTGQTKRSKYPRITKKYSK